MQFDWQNMIVGLIVVAAAGYLAISLRRALVHRRSACGACSTCPAAKAEEPLVIALDPGCPHPLHRQPGRRLRPRVSGVLARGGQWARHDWRPV